MTSQTIPAPDAAPSFVLSPTHPRVRRAMETWAVASMLWKAAKTGRTWATDRRSYKVSVEETDDLYPRIHAWIMEQVPAERRKSLTARTIRRDDGYAIPASDSSDMAPGVALSLFYDGAIGLSVTIAGHACRVGIERKDRGGQSGTERGSYSSFREPDRIVIDCRGAAAREAVVDWLRTLMPEQSRRIPRLYVGTRWGDWSRSDVPLPERPLDTVIVPSGVLDDLTGDIDRFLAAEADYALIGQPWHRGYVFHGPPGSGKTSLARAIATHYARDVYYLPVSVIEDDETIGRMIASVRSGAMLLIEDVDVVHASRERDDVRGGVTTAGLLNALDGVVTPHGLMTVMTTNRIGVLDRALIRPGRADRIIEVGYLDRATAVTLAARVTGIHPYQFGGSGAAYPLDVRPGTIVAADLTSAAAPHLGNPEAMAAAMVAAVAAARQTVAVPA